MARIGRSAPFQALILRRPVVALLAPLATLTDDFSGSLAKWPLSVNASIVGGQAAIPCAPSYDFISTNAIYNFIESSVFAKITPATGGTRGNYFAILLPDTSNYLTFVIDTSAGTTYLTARITQGGVDVWSVSAPYDPFWHQWLGFSVSGTTVNWWASSNGANWTSLVTHDTTLPLNTAGATFRAGYSGTETAATMYVDNVNIPGQLLTPGGIPTGEAWRQTEPYTRWFGQGVAEGTLLTTSVVGAGDDAFTSIGGASSQAVVSNTDIQFTYTTGNSTAQWFFTPTNWQMARCDLVVPPTGMATSLQIARLMDTAGNSLSGITLTGAGVGIGKVRIVRPDTTTHLESTWQLVQGTRYVMQVLFGPNGATNYFRVNFYDHATGALYNSISTTTLPLGTGSQQPGRIYFGAWFYATSGQSITMGDFAYQDTDGTNLNDEIQWITTVGSNYTVTTTGIPTGEALGFASTGAFLAVTPTGIATGAVLGTAVVLGGAHPYIASTTSIANAGATSIVITVPAGMQIGDMMLVALAAQNSVPTADFTNTGPVFTRIGLPFVSSDTTIRVLGWFAHVFTATPPSTVTFTAPNGTSTRLAGIAMRVLNAGIPVAAQAAGYGTGGAGLTPSGSTATVPHDGCLALFTSTNNVTAGNSGDVATPPTGMTLVGSVVGGGGAASGTWLHVYKQKYETGTTDSKTLTFIGPSVAQSSTNLMVLEGGKVAVTGIASGEAFGTSICRFLPAMETFTDTFDSSVSAITWPVVENGGAVWEAGRAKIIAPTPGAYTSSHTAFGYDFRNSFCFVRMTPHTNSIDEMETVFTVSNAANDGGSIIISKAPTKQIVTRKRQDSVFTDTTLPFDPVAQRWFMMKLTGTTLDYLSSPDGVFWTSIRTETITSDLSTVRVRIRCGNYGATAGTGIAYFDNFNVVVPEDVSGVWNGTMWRTDAEIWNGTSWCKEPVIWNGDSWVLL